MNKLTLFLIFFFIIIVGGSLAIYNLSQSDGESTARSIQTATADQIATDYSTDENAANTKYLDKKLLVTGTLLESSIDPGSTSTFVISTSQEGVTIRCEFQISESVKLYNVKTGMSVEVIGTCKGWSSGGEELDLLGSKDVILTDCLLDGYSI